MSDLTNYINDGNQYYPLSNVAAREWKSFAMYTVENRAIPNMIDGLKPVQRFYLYSSIQNTKRDFKKVSAVSGIISDYGYNHGEGSAAGSGQLMAATWNNNICLVEGRGSFGTRLIQDAGAPRYVYTRLHDNFNKYIKDVDLSPVHEDPEHEPPAHYLPVIPLVLANGTKGIATGFATNILPHCPESLAEACAEYLRTNKIAPDTIKVKFPEFDGTVEQDPLEPKRYTVFGVYEKTSKTQLTITEVPYGLDREGYVKVLDKLEDDGDIVSYEDLCDKSGFKFTVKLKLASSAKWNDAKIISKFKLSKVLSQNCTVIDQDGKLREYNDVRELVKDFCDYRFGVLQKRIDKNLASFEAAKIWLQIKMEFIQLVLDDKITFKNKNKKQIGDDIKNIIPEATALVDRLLAIPFSNLTSEEILNLEKQIKQAEKDLDFWNKATPKKQFLSDLKLI